MPIEFCRHEMAGAHESEINIHRPANLQTDRHTTRQKVERKDQQKAQAGGENYMPSHRQAGRVIAKLSARTHAQKHMHI